MLNVDYKIPTKVIANRLKPVLKYIISEDQTGFMEGRSISTNINKTFEVIQYAQKKDIPALIMTIDFEKCFDRIEHSAVACSLAHFNFGPTITRWIMLTFQDFLVRGRKFHLSYYRCLKKTEV